MNYNQFKNKFKDLPLIMSRVCVVEAGKNAQAIRNQLSRWQKNGLLIKLRRGAYLLNKNDRKITPSRYFIANQLYAPSYISLESALSFYGLIPERVSDTTSVCSKKTARFKNELGVFIYQQIKNEAFKGFKAVKGQDGASFFIAEPEKAVVDFLYLNRNKLSKSAKDVFERSYRFQNLETLRQKKIIESAKVFHNSKLSMLARGFCEFIKEQAKR